jgi:hypothetical protein
MTSIRSLTCAVLLAACGPGGGTSNSDTATSAPATTTTTTGATSTTTVTGGGTTIDATSSDPATTSATGTTPQPSTTPSETTSTTTPDPTTGSTGPVGTSSSSSSGDSTTDDPVGACKEAVGDHGPCDAILGYGLVGDQCIAISGCNCEPDCAFIFPDPLTCATTCAAAGECNEAIITGAGIGPKEVGPGSLCDEVNACVELPELKELFPGLTCEPGGMPCGGETCHLLFQNVLTPEQWTQICAASLLQGVDELYCVVFGP